MANMPPFTTADCGSASGPTDAVLNSGIGAFTEESDWMDGWTNWSRTSTPEDDGSDVDEIIDADIDADMTLSNDKIWGFGADVHVLDGVTLTIEAGTLIKSQGSASTLVVSRGGKLIAKGTKKDPIIFTSAKKNGDKKRGDWAGVVILGAAKNWDGSDTNIEGLPVDSLNQHGGSNDKDNSGELSYVRIEFAGTELADGNEINGLTMGSVGSGTKISYVQVSTTLDDCFEWFGGTVSPNHLVCNDEGDDMFDADTGYRGTIDTFFGRQIFPVKDDPNGLEWDSNLDDKASPQTNLKASKGTVCGVGSVLPAQPAYGALFRENVTATVDNFVEVGFQWGFDIRDDSDVTMTDSYAWGNAQGLCNADEDDDDNGLDDCAWFTDQDGNTAWE
jgi:hypothetical protein